jgi:hypothetical protein
MAALYTLTIFTSAFLLFLIQPMISKLLLPQLGGSPAVWNTSMLFFQTFLLLGYLYTHLSGKFLGAKKQTILHISLLLISIAWLPITLYTDVSFSSSNYPISWVIVSLFFSVGLPFFLLAANAPLLQFWLANTSHKDAHNPYFLYSASNVGSLLALLSYPVLIERALTLPTQTHVWSMLFCLFIALIAACAFYRTKHPITASQAAVNISKAEPAPTLRRKLYWMLLAAGPSSLMLGLTTYITTDISPIPLFWVIPLALYLVTFIAAFSKYSQIVDYALKAQNIFVPLTLLGMVMDVHFPYGLMILHVITFFITAMVCHGTLARKKPDAKHLTEFYVWMSLGGMLGGVFNAIIAPNIFTNTIEYSIAFFLCLLLRPSVDYVHTRKEYIKDVLIPLAFGAALVGVSYATGHLFSGYRELLATSYQKTHTLSTTDVLVMSNSRFIYITVLFLLIMTVIDRYYKRPLRFTLLVASLFCAIYYTSHGTLFPRDVSVIYADRSFFGILRAYAYEEPPQHLLKHGTTTHGVQSLEAKYRLRPLSYYHPLPVVKNSLDPALKDYPYAVLGLGTGTSACVGHKNQVVDIYEIDPAVIKIANNPELFTYLRDCPTKHNIILGDGRLSMAAAPDHRYGLIVIDAFTSDAIPIHLLTKEAVAIYRQKVAEHGIIALHISNRYFDLRPVAAALAEDAGLQAILLNDWPRNDEPLVYASSWVLLTNDPKFLARANVTQKWRELKNDHTTALWTDNYSNILQVLK